MCLVSAIRDRTIYILQGKFLISILQYNHIFSNVVCKIIVYYSMKHLNKCNAWNDFNYYYSLGPFRLILCSC